MKENKRDIVFIVGCFYYLFMLIMHLILRSNGYSSFSFDIIFYVPLIYFIGHDLICLFTREYNKILVKYLDKLVKEDDDKKED